MPDEETMTFRFEQRWSDAAEIVVQERFIGLSPAILIEPKLEDGEIILYVITVDLDSDALVDLLQSIVEAARQGLPGVSGDGDSHDD